MAILGCMYAVGLLLPRGSNSSLLAFVQLTVQVAVTVVQTVVPVVALLTGIMVLLPVLPVMSTRELGVTMQRLCR
jgi:hypothetical protein